MQSAPLTSLPPLIALRAPISNGALQAAELPKRLKLLNWGENESTQGKVIVDDATLAAMDANQRALGYDRVALDFGHNTVPGSPEFERTKEPRSVAAYGVPEVVKGDGLFLKDLTWTPAGQAEARNYADLSPTPSLDKTGRVMFLHSAALVRNGAVHDLSFFSAPQTPSPDLTMNPDQVSAAITTALKPILEVLTPLAAEVKALKESKPALPTFETKVGDKTVTLDAGQLLAKVVTLETQLTAAQAAAETAEKATLVARFAAEGKAPKGEDGQPMDDAKLTTFGVPELKRLLANTPATVPLSARGPKSKTDAKDENKVTGLDRAINAHRTEVAARS